MQAFDQRWIRKAPGGFKALGSARLCDACGYTECRIRGELAQSICAGYVPVISFDDRAGLDRVCNTFRRGLGLVRRLEEGQVVRLYSKKDQAIIGTGKIGMRHSGELHRLLPDHARNNHLMLQESPLDAPGKLFAKLRQIYGSNHAAADAPFSVVYLEPISA